MFAAPHPANLSASLRLRPDRLPGLGDWLGESSEGAEVDVWETEAGGGTGTLQLSLWESLQTVRVLPVDPWYFPLCRLHDRGPGHLSWGLGRSSGGQELWGGLLVPGWHHQLGHRLWREVSGLWCHEESCALRIYCYSNRPGVYTRISVFLNWISRNISDN